MMMQTRKHVLMLLLTPVPRESMTTMRMLTLIRMLGLALVLMLVSGGERSRQHRRQLRWPPNEAVALCEERGVQRPLESRKAVGFVPAWRPSGLLFEPPARNAASGLSGRPAGQPPRYQSPSGGRACQPPWLPPLARNAASGLSGRPAGRPLRYRPPGGGLASPSRKGGQRRMVQMQMPMLVRMLMLLLMLLLMRTPKEQNKMIKLPLPRVLHTIEPKRPKVPPGLAGRSKRRSKQEPSRRSTWQSIGPTGPQVEPPSATASSAGHPPHAPADRRRDREGPE